MKDVGLGGLRRGSRSGDVSDSPRRPEQVMRSLIDRGVLSPLLVEEGDGDRQDTEDGDDNLGVPVKESGDDGNDREEEENEETDDSSLVAIRDESSFSWRKCANAGSSCTDEEPFNQLKREEPKPALREH